MQTTPDNKLHRRRLGLGAHTRLGGRLLVGAVATITLLAPVAAQAQSDVTPPLPNVLILLDTSGSMERMPNATFPTVAAGSLMARDSSGVINDSQKNRWIQAMEVLSGRVKDLDILHVARSTEDFRAEYALGALNPYDYNYYVPHFRILSKGCAVSPRLDKMWPTDWKTWNASAFSFRKWTGSVLGAPGSECDDTYFETDGLGIMDTFRDQARFAFMGFDPLTDANTGWDGTSHLPSEGMAGTWSYYPGWNSATGKQPFYGWPGNCSVDPANLSPHVHELGARNPSAPPWEFPLIPFATDNTTDAFKQVNDRIRYAMLAGRPYGATPLGPMMADAKHYLWADPQGPSVDPTQVCRGNFIILITDGFPNSDLRPSCEDPTDPKTPPTQVYSSGGCGNTALGCCPTKRVQDIAKELATPPDTTKPKVQTFVVGFAVSDELGNAVNCKAVDVARGDCLSPTAANKPCCTLHETAFNGGTSKALFADNVDELRQALVGAMSAATAKTSTSRTVPIFTQAASATTSGAQYEFQTSFKVNAFGPWLGVLNRVQWKCDTSSGTLRASPQQFLAANGDDYANNLRRQVSRNFFTLKPPANSRAGDSLRPGMSTSDTDGVPIVVPTVTSAAGSTFVGDVPATSLELGSTPCKDTTTVEECKTKLLNYALALPQPNPLWFDRSVTPLGDIYHATPINVGPPSDFLRDESYVAFRNNNVNRIPMLLVATNDGILHGFRTDVQSESDVSELWSFIPPAVLPDIGKQYGGAHLKLMDASPVVKDVAFGALTGSASATAFGRTRANARGGVANWRTVAVGGLTSGRGYYALDVTEPTNPKVLWQLTRTKDTSGVEYDLFGTQPGTPAIGTIFYKDPNKSEAIETPVAFLPGGEGTHPATQPTSGLCNRWRQQVSAATTATTWRSAVRCWIGAGNSLTIVRLYDGKILRRFSNNPAGDGSANHPAESASPVPSFIDAGQTDIVKSTDSSLNGYAGIDSPITGAVSLYPGSPGTVTTRAFVGDADGGLWKIDVAPEDPKDWSMKLFHDAYFPGDSVNTSPAAWGPISTPPVLTVDAFGDTVVLYSTGDQNNFSTTSVNHVYSVTERTKTSTTAGATADAEVNWHLRFTNGITATGPMSLFDGTLYFSTFKPDTASSDACLSGEGTVWGVDYLRTDGTGTAADGTAAPAPRHPNKTTFDATKAAELCPAGYSNLNTGSNSYRCINLGGGTIVFGAGITQRPSCVTPAASPIGTDPYLGGTSNHTPMNDIAVGTFELVAQTGPKASSTGPQPPNSGTTTTGVNTFSMTLTPPFPSTRIDSWAAVIE